MCYGHSIEQKENAMDALQMKREVQQVDQAVGLIKERIERAGEQFGWYNPQIAVTLGSGLGGLDTHKSIQVFDRVSYLDVGLPMPTVDGHAGELCLARVGGKNVLLMRGRKHCYEDADLTYVQVVVRAVRALVLAGIETHILTCAAGAVNRTYRPQQVVRIKGHWNYSGRNPLVGVNNPDWGKRFPDMTEAYDEEMRGVALRVAKQMGEGLAEGNYAMLLGPNYEHPSEIDLLARHGHDLVGMSTIPEVLALRHLASHPTAKRNIRVQAFAYVTNMGAGITGQKLDHEEVKEAGRGEGAKWFENFMVNYITELPSTEQF